MDPTARQRLDTLRDDLRDLAEQERALHTRRLELQQAYAELLPGVLGAAREGQRIRWRSPSGHTGVGIVERTSVGSSSTFAPERRLNLTDDDVQYTVRETPPGPNPDLLVLSHVRDRVEVVDV